MATVLRNVYVSVDGTDLSSKADEVTITEEADQQDATTFGNDGYRTFERGLITGTINVRFNMDHGDSGGVHDTLYPIWVAGDEVELAIGPEGSSGPDIYVADVRLFSYSFVQGSVGEISRNPVTFQLTAPPRVNNT